MNNGQAKQGAAVLAVLGVLGGGTALYPQIATTSDVEALRLAQTHVIEVLRSETQRKFELMEIRILQESLKALNRNIAAIAATPSSLRTTHEKENLLSMRESRNIVQRQINSLLSLI